jgi:iron complex transport system substrate-binding protein
MSTHPNRRQLLGAGAGLALAAVTASRSRAQESTPAASPAAEGEWTFTDDKGVTVTLPARPQRIVADVNAAAPLWDFGIRPVALFGWNASESGDFGDAGGNIDPTGLAIVGDATEPIKPEPVAAQHPDLIVTITWTPDDPTEYWSIDTEILPQVQPIAPIVAISATGSADVNTERFAELAASLGADLSTPEQAAAKAAYDQALADFPVKAAEKADLTILFAYLDTSDLVYIANAPDWADLTLYANLGFNIVKPDAEQFSFWEELSAEQAGKYPTDVIFHSTRLGTLSADEMKAHPIFSQLPAVKAGQIAGWNQDFIMSYQGMADALNNTVGAIANAQKII